MAEYTVKKDAIGAHAKQLSAAAVDTVVFEDDLDFVEIVSDGAAAIYVTVDRPAPTVGGSEAYFLPAAPCARTLSARSGGGGTAVRLISAGTPTYSVAKAV